jgi:predicted metal-dependent enzyme (double-stranded beta helix superfamily)
MQPSPDSLVADRAPLRLRHFVDTLDALIDRTTDEAKLLADGGRALASLVAQDDWLPDAYAVPNPDRYTQYLLYRDPAARYSVVSFVWGPGQSTPVHDHTVWGIVGVLRGAEIGERYAVGSDHLEKLVSERLEAGAIDPVSPRVGDVHRVRNAFDDRVSISIHVYGADIGAVRRHIFDEAGRPKEFISGYADAPGLSF